MTLRNVATSVLTASFIIGYIVMPETSVKELFTYFLVSVGIVGIVDAAVTSWILR